MEIFIWPQLTNFVRGKQEKNDHKKPFILLLPDLLKVSYFGKKVFPFLTLLLLICLGIWKKSSQNKVILQIQSLSPNQWRATYQLPEKVNVVFFQRPAAHLKRESQWLISPKDLFIQKQNGKDIIQSRSNQPFDSFQIEFHPSFEGVPKDYVFFQSFSQQAHLLYTGHLSLQPYHSSKSYVHQLSLSTSFPKHIILPEKKPQTLIHWTDHSPHQEGTYAYIGPITPFEEEGMSFLMDPSLPPWIPNTIKTFLPEIFSFYKKKLQIKLPFQPLIFFNYEEGKKRGRSNKGGVVGRGIQFLFEGQNWKKGTEENRLHLIHFLAHEMAHLWNGTLFHNEEDKAAWIHEGGAEAFADRFLLEKKLIDSKTFWKNQMDQFNLCLNQLNGTPLNEMLDQKKFQPFYTCGSLLMLLIEETLAQKEVSDPLFVFWKKLFENSKKQGRNYHASLLYQTLASDFQAKGFAQFLKHMTSLPPQIENWCQNIEAFTKKKCDIEEQNKRVLLVPNESK